VPGIQNAKNKVFSYTNHLHNLVLNILAKKHFQVVCGWVTPDKHLCEKYQNRTFTRLDVSHLMAYNSLHKYSAMRKMEEQEVLDLGIEFMNLPKIYEQHLRVAEMYNTLLKENVLSKFLISDGFFPSYFRYPILFSNENKRNICLDALSKAGFVVNYRYKPLHKSPFFSFGNCKTTFNISVDLSKRLLPLPVDLSFKDIERITEIVNSLN
jgi:dTDP-4-amino-4,6-dideoxygalactose transaminase